MNLLDPAVARTGSVDARDLLKRMFEAAVGAADPLRVLAEHLPEKPRGRCIVVGAGKAAAAMAIAVERAWPDVDLTGSVVVPYGYHQPKTNFRTQRIEILQAAHPVPDANSEIAARRMLELVRDLEHDDLVLSLISGGGSAVMSLPVEGLSLQDKQGVNRALLASGLDIRAMNAVRRRLSAIKGGKLARAAAPARIVTLAISDIPGDDVSAIASGPTIPDPDAGRDLTSLAKALKGHISDAAYRVLTAHPPAIGGTEPSDVRLVATPRQSLNAAADIARNLGIEVVQLGDDLEGESQDLGREMAARAAQLSGPCVLISGGETTVTLSGQKAGVGGRNTEFALAFALAAQGMRGVWALAADTDGEDGASGGGAGAIVSPDTLSQAEKLGIDAVSYLAGHDSGSFFAALGDLLVSGPTCTNVNDFRAILLLGDRR
ncbi:MAG: glycerate kinase [Sphingomonadales bacterium]|nr:glycerate kinase [Sphingomonadales bacterium]MBK9267214.1 glycerate kinase [Sphingomonadales bacterium]